MVEKITPQAGSHPGKKLPTEAYEYNDDVTAVAVEKVRQRAREILAGDEWEVIDGFGRDPQRVSAGQ